MTSAAEKKSEFEKATAIEQTADNVFRGVVPDGWQQGKGAFGGVVVGMLTRALIGSEADRERTLRSLTADLCAPAMPGAVEVQVSTLRRGASISFLDAKLLQDGSVVARASAALGSKRSVRPAAIRSPAPVRPPWTDVATIPVAPPIGPVFARNYEYRATGPLPFSGGKEALAEGWLRERLSPATLDEAAIAGLIDAWWPTTFAVETSPRGVATVGYTMQLLVDPRSLRASEPLFYRARGVAASESFFIEMRELWSEDGIVAMNQQTFALLG